MHTVCGFTYDEKSNNNILLNRSVVNVYVIWSEDQEVSHLLMLITMTSLVCMYVCMYVCMCE